MTPRSTGRAEPLHNERAVHAQKRRQRSRYRLIDAPTAAGHVVRPGFRPLGPVKDRHDDLYRCFHVRLLDREQPATVVAARAVLRVVGWGVLRVRIRVRTFARGPAVTACPRRRGVIRRADQASHAGIVLQQRAGLARQAADQHAEVAAAERHHARQEQGDEGADLAATCEHTTGECTGGRWPRQPPDSVWGVPVSERQLRSIEGVGAPGGDPEPAPTRRLGGSPEP